jgi:hypothetical protein
MWLLLGCSDYALNPDGGPPDGLADTDEGGDPESDGDDGWVMDTFVVDDRTDILFFGDTSGSMEPELATMADNLDVFLTRLATFGTDWQLLAVTGPDGCGRNGIIRADTPDYAARFEEGLTTPPGEDLVDEWGLNNVMAAVQNAGPGQCNEGFLRDGALLHVIFISDEDDNSPGYENGGDYWRPYVEAVQAARGDAASVRFSAVGGPVPDGCDGAEPANGYWDAVLASEGTFISICDDWSTRIEDLAATSAARTVFPLSSAPDPASIEIKIDEDLRTGWTYVPADNSVRFTTDAPVAGQTVRIHYLPG